MRAFVATILLLCCTSILAQDQNSGGHLWGDALRAVTGHVHGLIDNALPDKEDMGQYAFTDATAGREEQAFRAVTAHLYDPVTADEMVDSYIQLNRASLRIGVSDVNGARVLPLEEFATGPYTYDWKRLNEKYPRIHAIFRVSQPAIAGYRALIGVDVITPAGTPWLNFLELERQTDGSWKLTRGSLGAQRNAPARDPRVLSRAGLE
jgi:hypothetical protein